MSKIESALQAAQPGLSRLRSGAGGMGYRAATTQAEQPRSSLLDSIGRFAVPRTKSPTIRWLQSVLNRSTV